MNQVSTNRTTALTQPTVLPLVESTARRIVLDRLQYLGSGRLTVSDAMGTTRFGEPSELSARIEIHSEDFYRRVLVGGSLGAAESFVDGGWSSDNLATTLRLFARDLDLANTLDTGWSWFRSLTLRAINRLNVNNRSGSAANIHAHYDLGNPFFQLFLDPTMNYSAGVFVQPGQTMEEASIAKMERICRKLRLQRNDHLLEIGTGWGPLAIYAASNYGCRVTTTTISGEQYEWTSRRVAQAGLEGQITVLQTDYRDLTGRYEKLVSVEMIEAVGHAYLDVYFRQCAQLLHRDGLMLLQAIVTPEYRQDRCRRSVDFIKKYIFPGSCLTSLGQISLALGRSTDFSTLHMEDIGPHYAETLRRWRQRFRENIASVEALGYDERFIRLWDYYLCYCEAGFEERILGDIQLLLGRPAHRHQPLLGDLAEPVTAEAS